MSGTSDTIKGRAKEAVGVVTSTTSRGQAFQRMKSARQEGQHALRPHMEHNKALEGPQLEASAA